MGLLIGCAGGAEVHSPHDAGGVLDVGVAPDVAPIGIDVLAVGQRCGNGSDCETGFCVEGVCCISACSGPCLTCAAPGAVGTCIPADVGTDPRNDCNDDGRTSCKHDGTCDGTGACAFYVSGVVCHPPSCVGTALGAAGRCDGHGTCNTPGTQSCAPYSCGADTHCETSCTSTADCAPGIPCYKGRCGLEPLGAGCAASSDCSSGICAQGVCCGSACTGGCASCALAGSEGLCTNVPSGQQALDACLRSPPASCGMTGACDGKGQCQLYPAGTACKAAGCTNASYQTASTCNGTGVCAVPPTVACAPYTCGPGACKTTCVSSDDCSPSYTCVSGRCALVPAIAVQTHTLNNGNSQWVYFDLELTNASPGPIALPQLTIEYWYTWEGSGALTEDWQCTYANVVAGACGSVTASFVPVAPARTGADHVFRVGFTGAAGSLAPGATLNIGPGFHKSDFSSFVQSNDYSYNRSTTFTPTMTTTVYLNGTQIYGSEPM